MLALSSCEERWEGTLSSLRLVEADDGFSLREESECCARLLVLERDCLSDLVFIGCAGRDPSPA